MSQYKACYGTCSYCLKENINLIDGYMCEDCSKKLVEGYKQNSTEDLAIIKNCECCSNCVMFTSSPKQLKKALILLCAKVDPQKIVNYLTLHKWKQIEVKRPEMVCFQKKYGSRLEEFYQVNLPLKNVFSDYNWAMYRAIMEIAIWRSKSVLATIQMIEKQPKEKLYV